MSFRTAYGYTHSENGWRMVNRDGCVVAGPSMGLPYTNTAPIRAGVASTILVAWLAWYHRNVEPLASPVWGWSNTNDVANSNHLSGTAVDINAPKYPWGLRTMPAARIAKVREGLRLFEGTVFWGADWGRADEMHYQIGYPEGDARLTRFAERLSTGHLGIYRKDDTMSDADVSALKAFMQTYLGPGLSDAKDNRYQLTGSRDLVFTTDPRTKARVVDLGKSFPGHKQLGNRTLVDGVAAIGAYLGVPGFVDTLGVITGPK
ncbi:lysin A, L-Ala-D-Glu peptidase domain [Gordonia phage Rahul]|nr:lysin A, L-Ala-D-Glu peptidase domain [Gordonia phage Rahul]